MEAILFEFIGQYMPLCEEEKQAIRELSLFRSYAKGEVLLREGQRSSLSYFVLKGCVRSYYLVNGEERTTEFYTELQSVAPHCITSQQPSEYFIGCVEPSILLVAEPNSERIMFEKFPRFEKLCRILTEKMLVQKQVNLDLFKISSPEDRYGMLLNDRPELLQRVPQYQLASYLGITPQSLSRMRARMAQKAVGR